MNLALFDFDGTVTVTDTFVPFLRTAVRPSRALVGGMVLSPIYVASRCGWVSASRARPLYARFGFQGDQADSVRALGLQYARDVLPGLLQRRALDRIEWHQQQGDVVVVVSGSLDVYLKPWCKERGVDLICTELEEHNGVLTGRYVDGDCSGAEKTRRILTQYQTDRYSVIYAYGDTSEDREMLGIAHKKYYRWEEIADWKEASSYGHPKTRRDRPRN